ncbi:hypothetical protein KDL45_03750 [bacterium]|nr:hypothetical protein [bacterium]
MKKIISLLTVLSVTMMLSLGTVGCSKEPEVEPTPTPAPTPKATPAPTPEKKKLEVSPSDPSDKKIGIKKDSDGPSKSKKKVGIKKKK